MEQAFCRIGVTVKIMPQKHLCDETLYSKGFQRAIAEVPASTALQPLLVPRQMVCLTRRIIHNQCITSSTDRKEITWLPHLSSAFFRSSGACCSVYCR